MSEALDLDVVFPVLEQIESDISELKCKVNDLAAKMSRQTRRLDHVETRFTYLMGLTTRQRIDIMRVRSDITATKARLDKVER
jgi:DNA repair ATPase RecN